MANTVLRAATPADAETLTRIAHDAKSFWGYSQQLMDLWADDLAVIPENCDGESVWLVEFNEDVVGFGELQFEGNTAILDDLWIDPKHIGGGFGTMLFAHLRTVAEAHGAVRMTIEAEPNAVGFYQRMGARTIGEIHSESVPGRVLPLMEVVLEQPENTTIPTE